MAWQCVSPELTVKGIKRCCISNAADGTDDDMLWNGNEEGENVSSEYKKREGTECGDGDSDTDWYT